ncbi:MAG: F0F1 ATP synthase subunit alpha, partial [Chloroflexota bacterium]
MAVRGQDFVSILRQQIEQFGAQATMVEVGTVVEVGDGITRIHGLSGARYNELLEFASGAMGMALNLNEDSVGAVVLGAYSHIKEGEEVRCTNRVVEVPVGEEL